MVHTIAGGQTPGLSFHRLATAYVSMQTFSIIKYQCRVGPELLPLGGLLACEQVYYTSTCSVKSLSEPICEQYTGIGPVLTPWQGVVIPFHQYCE